MSVSNDGYERFEKMTMNAGNTCEISASLVNFNGTTLVTDGSVCLGKPRTGAVVGGVYTDQFAEINGVRIDFHTGSATSANDYDARISCSADATTNSTSTISFTCKAINFALDGGGFILGGSPGGVGAILVSAGAADSPYWLAAGAEGQFLKIVAGVPAWSV